MREDNAITSDIRIGSPPPRYLTYAQLSALGIHYSRKHLLDLMRAGRFPPSRQLSANRVGWLESEIRTYLENRPVSRAALFRKKKAASADTEESRAIVKGRDVSPRGHAAAGEARLAAAGVAPEGRPWLHETTELIKNRRVEFVMLDGTRPILTPPEVSLASLKKDDPPGEA
jgi:predicted DNA-binding transcriptional regulator AlpA